MKKSILSFVLIQAILGGLLFLGSIPFHSCEPEPDPEEHECDTCIRVMKPNIYLYPTENKILSVTLNFPSGGKIITSIPDYGNGWLVSVDTDGIINNEFEYLFYESEQPDVWQTNEGWIINVSDLEQFFTDNLSKYGFIGREINDFTNYWIPRLKRYEYYEIYPQEKKIIDNVITLEITDTPDSVLRLFYLIRGTDSATNSKIIAPEDNIPFIRTGFCVTEWGVVLK
ncbi:MAG: hypothetical protein WAW07_03920 [Bacteroidales bacterium]